MRTPARLRLLALPALAALLAAGPAQAQVLLLGLDSPNDEPGNGAFGQTIAGTGDLDGDGTPDLLVGAYIESPGESPERAGRAFALSGATGAVLHAPASPDEQLFGLFGYAVARVPDADGDGTDDLLVGARYEDGGGVFQAGRAHLFSGATGALLHTLASPAPVPSGDFGSAVAGVPDVDGAGDLLIGGREGEA